jgi:hypothetical protein
MKLLFEGLYKYSCHRAMEKILLNAFIGPLPGNMGHFQETLEKAYAAA